MKLVYIIGLMLILSSVSVLGAFEDIQISVRKAYIGEGLFDKPFSLFPDKTTYLPGESMSIEAVTSVPCNTQQAMFSISKIGGSTQFSADVTGLVYPCATNVFIISSTAPSSEGDYIMSVTYRDWLGETLYTDGQAFSVSTGIVSCPDDGCTGWTNLQKFETGWLQEKICTFYDESDNCKQTSQHFNRLNCDSGYHEESGQCISNVGPPVCGNSVVETGESCDRGFENGLCPNLCSNSCTTNTCEILSVCGNHLVEAGEQCDVGPFVVGDSCTDTCQLEPGNGNNGGGGNRSSNIELILAASVLLVGLWLFVSSGKKRKGRKRRRR